jgi:hypothetical protein
MVVLGPIFLWKRSKKGGRAYRRPKTPYLMLLLNLVTVVPMEMLLATHGFQLPYKQLKHLQI